MLVKACIAATALICAAVLLSAVDFRDLYNEMYPVNGLKRDVLGLCHQAQPTFIRAIRGDRVNCYDSMPDNVELAIGWVRTSSRLAALSRKPTAMELAERLLAEPGIVQRLRAAGPTALNGYLTTPAVIRPCADSAPVLAAAAATPALPLGDPDRHLARELAAGGDAALAAIGLKPHRDKAAPALPVLSLGATGAGEAAGEPLAAPAAADTGGLALVPRTMAQGCKAPV